MDIVTFKKNNKAKKVSALKQFEVEIMELHNDNYSLKSIAKFLQKNGLKTTFQNVSRFINSHHKSKVDIQKKSEANKGTQVNHTDSILPKLEKVGKDLELKEAPDWAN